MLLSTFISLSGTRMWQSSPSKERDREREREREMVESKSSKSNKQTERNHLNQPAQALVRLRIDWLLRLNPLVELV